MNRHIPQFSSDIPNLFAIKRIPIKAEGIIISIKSQIPKLNDISTSMIIANRHFSP
jgi:hypothetical protein